ncbi:nitronate monooxygenase [Macrococcus capreoli]|uniref:NAD(P)H-dependent flavin oxidoreductase n=1 Tax=Macrococcus capreoli TaxID=2982690 RepID=UPI003EE4EFAE
MVFKVNVEVKNMWQHTKLTEHLNIRYPIIQAGMAGSTTPELVASVCNEGGLGTIGAGYMSLETLEQEVNIVQRLTDKPYAVNLFVPEPFNYDNTAIEAMQTLLEPYYQQYNITTAEVKDHPKQHFIDAIQLLIRKKVPVVSFTFGLPSTDIINLLKSNGIKTIATAGSVREAQAIEQAGIDIVVAQGHEAGGHKGTYTNARGIGSMALIPQIADSLTIPVVAAGGIMDARGVLAALTLGASGVQMGTAFLTSHESKAPVVHKDAILKAKPDDTTITKVFSGKAARGIENDFIRHIEATGTPLPYPLQNDLTTPIRKQAAQQGDTNNLHMWCGQAPMLAKRNHANELLSAIVTQVDYLILGFVSKNTTL